MAYSAVQTRERAGWIIGAYLFGAGVISLLAPFLSVAGIGIGNTAVEEGDRLSGGIGDPNEFAALLIPAIALSIGAAAASKTPSYGWPPCSAPPRVW